MSSVASMPALEARGTAARIWCPFHVMIASIIVMFTFFFCGHSVADPDIWWHLKNAQILVQQHHWVRADQFSYTVRGTPWVDSEWLSELMFYGAWRVGGITGLFLLYSTMAELIMVGTLLLSWKASGNIKSALLPGMIAVMMSVVNFGPRTILFGWACFLALMFVLWKMMNTGRAPLWTVPLIFFLWVNFHGSWLVGFVVFGIVVAAGLVSGTWGNVVAEKWTPQQRRSLLITAAATIPALFLNPYGYRIVFYPFDLAYRQKLNVNYIIEWASINFHEPRGKIVFGVILLLFLLALWTRRQWRLAEVALVCFALYISLTYVRFLFPAAIIIAPIVARQLDFLPPYKPEIDRPVLNALFSLTLLGFTLWHYPRHHALEEDLAKKMPDGGLQYLQAHAGPSDRIYNHYGFGGYMIWKAPTLPVFVDSRTDIFEYKGVLKDYLDSIKLTKSLEVIDKYHARFVFFPSDDPVTYTLRQSPKWRVVFDDGISCVFERTALQAAGA